MIYVLDVNEVQVGILNIDCPNGNIFYDDKFTENTDGSKELTFKVPLKRTALYKNTWRYVRNSLNGSNNTDSNVFNDIQVYSDGVNVALNKSVKAYKLVSDSWVEILTPEFTYPDSLTNYSYVVDENIDNWVIPSLTNERQRVVVDLGNLYNIDEIKMFHFYYDTTPPRKFKENILEISHDGKNWVKIFDSGVDGEYEETSAGKTVTVENFVVNSGDGYNIADNLIVENTLIYKKRNGDFELMRITEVEEANENGTIIKDIRAENCAIGDLARNVIEPQTISTGTVEFKTIWVLSDLLTDIMAGSDWNITRVDADTTQTVELKFEKHTNTYDLLKQVADLIGLEIAFNIKLQGLRIIAKNVELKILGSETNTLFYYTADLTDVKREIDSTDIITTIYPIGKLDDATKTWQLLDNTDTIDPLFADDFEFTTDGKKLYSKWALNRWGNGKHRVGIMEKSDVTDSEVLLAFATEELSNRIYPNIEYSMKLVTYTELFIRQIRKPVSLGDDVIIIDSTFRPQLRIRARVTELTTSYFNPLNDEIIIGEAIEVN